MGGRNPLNMPVSAPISPPYGAQQWTAPFLRPPWLVPTAPDSGNPSLNTGRIISEYGTTPNPYTISYNNSVSENNTISPGGLPDIRPGVRRGPGRPAGACNKPKIPKDPTPIRRGKGRPLGSKNKPKESNQGRGGYPEGLQNEPQRWTNPPQFWRGFHGFIDSGPTQGGPKHASYLPTAIHGETTQLGAEQPSVLPTIIQCGTEESAPDDEYWENDPEGRSIIEDLLVLADPAISGKIGLEREIARQKKNTNCRAQMGAGQPSGFPVTVQNGPEQGDLDQPSGSPVAIRNGSEQGHPGKPSAFPISSSQTSNKAKPSLADLIPPRIVAAGTIPPALPPSVEAAYRKKCIELKRRMTEVEESNDSYRLRKARLQRGIRKMRLERAYLLEILGKRMKKNGSSIDGFQGVYDEDSEGSSEGPPTPHEKPLRSKRSHRRPVSSPPPMLGHQQHRSLVPSHNHPTSAFEPPNHPFRESSYQHVPTTNGHAPIQYQPHPSSIPSQPISPSAQPLHRGPTLPRSAFDEFLEKHVMTRHEQFPYRDEEDAFQMAEQAWNDPQMRSYRLGYEDLYERNLQRYRDEMGEVERGYEREGFEPRGRREERREERRDGEMEVQRELPPPPPSRDGGVGGGFTSING